MKKATLEATDENILQSIKEQKGTGKTPQEHIQTKVIELAKERIVDTEETVSQIAYSLGFQYPQHLCRLFKRRVGCTPNEYRNQALA